MAAPSGADGEVLSGQVPAPLGVGNHPVGREKVNWTAGPREAGLGHDSARHSIGIRLVRRNVCARASRAGLRPTRPHCGQEGDNLRFSPSCQSPSFPSGRAARVKALSRLADATHLPKQHEGAKCHPVGARVARPPRPPCSDFLGGTLPPRRGECLLCGTAQARDPSSLRSSG